MSTSGSSKAISPARPTALVAQGSATSCARSSAFLIPQGRWAGLPGADLLQECAFVRGAHELHVLLGLPIGRYAVVPLHRTGAGIVGGEGEVEVAVKRVEKGAQIARSAED